MMLDLMDPSPTPKNRRLDPATYAARLAERRAARTDEEWEQRARRLEWFINQIIEMSIRALPREVRRRWKGNSAVDATVVPAFARADRRRKRQKKGKPPEVLVHSADPDADWYVRNPTETKPDGEADRAHWAYELSMIVSGSDDPSQLQTFPSLAMGMAILHKPSRNPGGQAVRALTSVRGRGHPARLLAGDRAYSSAKPEDLQLPARALGYEMVFDYKIDQLGIQDSYAGMLQIEGAWYCPAIPTMLVEATIDFRNSTIDEPCGCRECHPGTLTRTFMDWLGKTKLGHGLWVPKMPSGLVTPRAGIHGSFRRQHPCGATPLAPDHRLGALSPS